MRFSTRCRLAAFLLAAGALGGGCGRAQSLQEATDKALAENPRYQKIDLAKFSGRVAIDGQPPPKDSQLWIFLNDPQKLDKISNMHPPELKIECDEDGRFSYTTMVKGDGVPPGKYIVTFVCLKTKAQPKKRGGGRFGGDEPRMDTVKGSDELRGLYNDPEQNAKIPEFNLDLQPPGKDDYQFNLQVAGKDEQTPGPHAITTIIKAP
jgi:hypothetical protein